MSSAAELMVLFKGDASGLDKAAGESKGLIGGLVDGLGKIGLAGMGFGVIKDAAMGIIGPIGDSISAAEGLDDAIARSDAVFGSASASLVQHASEQANALGMTKEAYMAAAGGMGNLLTNMGVGKEKAAEMSGGLADLAPKLAAFAGVDTDKAMAAMEKGLTGATKGLKEMGIVIPDIPKGLDDAAKAAFIYDNVLKQSGDAQAAWAGNSGDVENSMARVTAAMTDAKATIGSALLPILAPLAEKLAGLASTLLAQLGPALDQLKGWLGQIDFAGMFSGLTEGLGSIDFAGIFGTIKTAIAGIDWAGIGQSVMTFAGYFKDGLMVVLPIVAAIFKDVLWPILQTVFNFFKEHTGVLAAVGLLLLALTGPIGAVVAAFTILGALGPKIGEWVSAIGTGLVEGIGGFVGMVVDAITTVADAIIDAFKSYFGIASPSSVFADFGINLLEGLVNGVLGMIATVIATFGSLGDQIFAAWETIKAGVMATVEMIRVMISAKWDAIGEYLSAKLDSIGKAISDAFDAARAVIETMVAKYLAIVTEAWSNIFGAIDTALGKVRGVVDSVLSFVEEKTGLSMGAARQVVSDVIGAISGFFDGMKVVVSDVIGAVASLLTGDFSGAVDGMKRAAEAGLSAVMGLFAGLGRAVMDAIGNARDLLVQVGTDLIEGLRAGISKSWDAVTSWLSGLFGDIVTLAKKILGIASPSRVMRDQVGQPIAMGIVEGIRMTLAANPIAGLVAGWAQASNGASIGAALGGTLKAAVIAGLMLSGATNGGALIEGRHAQWGANATPSDGRMGLQKGSGLTGSADDGRVRADAFRSGKGGLLAASSSNYWQIFVSRWGVPTEASAIKVSKQLGIPLPQWLLDIYHPPTGSTVDRPDVLKDPAPAAEAGAALKQLAKAGDEAVGAFSKIPPAVALLLDDLKNGRSGSNPIVRPLPGGGGIGGPIPIPGPGGTTTFGGAGGGVTGATISAQTVQLRGPVNIGMNATLAIGGGRTLTATLVDALITDTASFDKLIQAEDRRRAQT